MIKLFNIQSSNKPLMLVLSIILRLGLCALFLTRSTVWATELKEVTHYTLHYPPYWQVNDGELRGYHYDMSKALYNKAGLKANFVIMPYGRIEAKKVIQILK